MCWAASHPTGSRGCVVRVSAILQMVFLRDISSDRRLAILAVCVVEWRATIADAVVETHDRIVGKIWRDARRLCDTQINDAKTSLQNTLRSFKNLGAALLEAKGDDAPLDPAVATTCGWNNLETLVATAAQLGNTMSAEPLAHVVQGYHRFRRYAPRMLRALDIKSASVAEPLMAAANIIIENNDVAEKPITFLRRNSKWLRHLKVQETDCHLAMGSRCNVPPARCIPVRRYLVGPFPALRRLEAGFGADRSSKGYAPPDGSIRS